ncbi:MAG: peptidylprolyl isomerase [Candidatus Sumerlaea chitinivorans]|nr:peptidylprolyl isomerase [Candidatus Sumerlaea chitinivorans]
MPAKENDYLRTLLIAAGVVACLMLLLVLASPPRARYVAEPPLPKFVSHLQSTPTQAVQQARLSSHEADAEPNGGLSESSRGDAAGEQIHRQANRVSSVEQQGHSVVAELPQPQVPAPPPAVDLPVMAPTPSAAAPTPNAGSSMPPNSFEEWRAALRSIRGGSAPVAQPTASAPTGSAPPIAVPKGFSQGAAPTPSPTPNVWQRARNIPSNLIQTPYPIQSNYTGGVGTDAGMPPTDAGSIKFWNSPLNTLSRPATAGGASPYTNAPNETPPPVASEGVGLQETPRFNVASLAPSPQPTTTGVRDRDEGRQGVDSGAQPTPAQPTPTAAPTPELEISAEKVTRLRSAEPTPQPIAAETPRMLAAVSPQILPAKLADASIEIARRDGGTTTTEFTVRKGRAQVTFSNVPAALVRTEAPTSIAAAQGTSALANEASSMRPSSGTQSDAAPKATKQTPTDNAGETSVERGVERLAQATPRSPLERRLFSRALAASVGDTVLTAEDIQRRIHAMEILRGVNLNEDQRLEAEGMIIQQWVEKTAIAAEAQRQGLTVTDEEVQERLEKVKARLGQNWPEAMRQAGFTEAEIEEETRKTLLMEKFIETAFAQLFPEQEIRKVYESNPERFQPSRRLHVYEIFKRKQGAPNGLIERQMQEIRRRLLAGEDFGEIARKESESPTRDKGGDLGWIDSSSPIAPRQAAALAEVQVGQITEVIELTDGYQILKLAEVQEPRPGYEGARELVVAQLKDYVIGLAYETALRHFTVKVRNKEQRPRPNVQELQLQGAKQTPTPTTKQRDEGPKADEDKKVPNPAAGTSPERVASATSGRGEGQEVRPAAPSGQAATKPTPQAGGEQSKSLNPFSKIFRRSSKQPQ